MNDSHRGPLLQRERSLADIWTRLDCIRGDGGLSLAKSNGLANKWPDDAADGSGRGQTAATPQTKGQETTPWRAAWKTTTPSAS
jgi:hypothetical protein